MQIRVGPYANGVTLMEILLVIAIAAFLVIIGVRQYAIFSRDNAVKQLQYTVSLLFQGAKNYYQANCRCPFDIPSNAYVCSGSTGTLDPSYTPASPSPFPVVKTTNLLSTFIQWPPPFNRLIDSTVGQNGFIVQFNLQGTTPGNRIQPFATYFNWEGTMPTSLVFPSTVVIGKIYHWSVEVGVKLNNSANSAVLGADCSTSLDGSGNLYPCVPNHPGNYVAWERTPSFSPMQSTAWWLIMPRIRQFNQLYTNDDMYGASNSSWTGNNYLCGG